VALDPSGNYLALMNSTPLCLPDCASVRPVLKERVLELEGEYRGLACLGGRVFEVVPGQTPSR
jgi:hypothetical protein